MFLCTSRLFNGVLEHPSKLLVPVGHMPVNFEAPLHVYAEHCRSIGLEVEVFNLFNKLIHAIYEDVLQMSRDEAEKKSLCGPYGVTESVSGEL